jgi:hypothetical protein
VKLSVGLILLLLVAGGCAAEQPTLVLPPIDGWPSLPVIVVDRSGFITQVRPAAQQEGTGDGIEGVTGRDDASWVIWTSGACTASSTITFEAIGAGYRLDVVSRDGVTIPPVSCPAVGLIRRLEMEFRQPIDPAAIHFSQR